MNPPCPEAEALRVMANELVANHNRQYGARSPKPKLCKNCTDKNGKGCAHCFFCGSWEHLKIGYLKTKKKTETNCFSG